MRLVLLRYQEGLPKRREVHLVPADVDGRVIGLCGMPFEPRDVEYVAELVELPCVACQLLSPEPDWEALARVPYPPRLPFPNSGP